MQEVEIIVAEILYISGVDQIYSHAIPGLSTLSGFCINPNTSIKINKTDVGLPILMK